ncbi:dihydrodipicolinate synthase family protein [Bremerella sp. JC817]|uniref:dihydrodipicolinate synthase family protein n=1 Tax=Bremerella sp. JC817 TaxID=3231756 RepID=UPI003459BBE3
MTDRIHGLVAATYTPFDAHGRLDVTPIEAMVEYLIASGIRGLYVCGSTGEGMSLTTDERCRVAEAYVQAAAGRVPIFVQVGHNSLTDAKMLAAHAESIGADAVSATCPSYFKIASTEGLIECMHEIASSAPGLPFYYYHIPVLTGSTVDIVDFLSRAGQAIPNLAGLKYTDTKLHEFQQCLELEGGRYDVVWGCDEMMLGALATGSRGAIGSTYNIAAPLYERMSAAFESGDMQTARQLQSKSIEMIRILGQFPFHSAMKEVLRMLGFEFGTCRLPQQSLTRNQVAKLREDLVQLDVLAELIAP